MKFGKLNNIEGLEFTLPDNPGENQQILQKGTCSQTPTLYIGCTGWGMKEWVGGAYPPQAKSKDFLQYYCKQFNTIELNTTHYRIPDVSTIDKWKAAATPDFKFCPKIPQRISHSRDLGLSNGLMMQFCEVIQQLDVHLGCCFMQMPPYFGEDRLSNLDAFLQEFPRQIPLAVEVRHESWFASEDASRSLFEVLTKYGVSTVITDVAGRRDVLHQNLTNAMVMVRFVGNDLHPTDYSRIDNWLDRLQTWFTDGLCAAYFFTHEPDNLKAPELALYLAQQAQEKYQIETRGPKLPYEAEGQQISLF